MSQDNDAPHEYSPIDLDRDIAEILNAPVDPEMLELARQAVEHQARLKEEWAKNPALEQEWIARLAHSLAQFDD